MEGEKKGDANKIAAPGGRSGGGRKSALLDRRMGAKKDGASRSLTTVIDWTARRRVAAAAVPGRCAVVRINVNLPPPRARDNDKRTMTKNRRRR